jgi:hypothetical protein
VRARSTIPEDRQQRDLVDLFSNPRTRLLVTGYDTPQGPAPLEGRDPRATVEVAHEALIRRWPTLRAWVDESREKLRARAAILRAKAEWEEKGSIDRFLLDPGIQLERGRSLLDSPGDVPVDDIREYVDRSIQKEERRLNAEREAALADQMRIAAAERQAKEAAEDAARLSEAARGSRRRAAQAAQPLATGCFGDGCCAACIWWVVVRMARGTASAGPRQSGPGNWDIGRSRPAVWFSYRTSAQRAVETSQGG